MPGEWNAEAVGGWQTQNSRSCSLIHLIQIARAFETESSWQHARNSGSVLSDTREPRVDSIPLQRRGKGGCTEVGAKRMCPLDFSDANVNAVAQFEEQAPNFLSFKQATSYMRK